MRFIKLGALAFFVAYLVACAGAGKKDEVDLVESSSSTELDPSSSGAQFVAIPKPETPSISIPQSARQEFALAKQEMIKQNWKQAVSRLLFMTETYPELAGVYVNLGISYSKLEKFEEAVNAYRFAIEKNPLNFDAYTNLGVVLRNLGEFEQAEKNYLDALALWPHHQDSLINLGVLYDMYMGKLPEALGYFKTAQQLNAEEDRTLKGWIVDLERRIPSE